MIVLMTCLDVVMIVAELCRKRHNKVTKNAGITSKKLKNGANYLNINVVTVTKRKSVKRKEKWDMKKKNDALDMENKRLQEQKAEAEQELKRAKKEVQTEKLKGAATTAATNIAESVGSLFGNNKVKTLERQNVVLQNRIFELEEDARQREQQQVEQIQEIRYAYEQQHRKLSEFTDFVRRYFPYVEEMMPTIKFLRDTLNFGDAVIRKLCTFKDVSIKGELYSREFNQHFKADGAVCSLKQNAEERFDLNIDGVSHVSWFRRKKDEFMETLGMPTRKQNRGIKL
jgi:hypothetical protein